jgi:TRAP-type C4-dicarboxylate transport system permease small subunit
MSQAPPRLLNRLDKGVRRLVEGLSIALLAGLTGICAMEVLLRNLAGASLGWADEFAGYLLVWLTFLGATLAQIEGGHIGADLASRWLSTRGAKQLEQGAQGILLSLQLFLLVYGARLAAVGFRDRATSLPVPMGILYAAVPFSAFLLVLVHAAAFARLARRESRIH